MTKITILAWVTTGSLLVYADLPIHFIFGIVFVGIMIEIEKIEKEVREGRQEEEGLERRCPRRGPFRAFR